MRETEREWGGRGEREEKESRREVKGTKRKKERGQRTERGTESRECSWRTSKKTDTTKRLWRALELNTRRGPSYSIGTPRHWPIERYHKWPSTMPAENTRQTNLLDTVWELLNHHKPTNDNTLSTQDIKLLPLPSHRCGSSPLETEASVCSTVSTGLRPVPAGRKGSWELGGAGAGTWKHQEIRDTRWGGLVSHVLVHLKTAG